MATPNGIVFPLSLRQGLPYLHLRPFTDEEWDTLPRIPAACLNLWKHPATSQTREVNNLVNVWGAQRH